MKHLKICFLGGKQAGIIGALTLLAAGHKIISAVSYSKDLNIILRSFSVPLSVSMKGNFFAGALKKADLLISVHGREIVDAKFLIFTQGKIKKRLLQAKLSRNFLR